MIEQDIFNTKHKLLEGTRTLIEMSDPEIALKATNLAENILSGAVLISEQNSTQMTAFGLSTSPGPSQILPDFIPTISVNSQLLWQNPRFEVASELLRNALLLDEFTAGNFPMRQRVLYSSVVERQKQWLEQNEIPEVNVDPRTMTNKNILSTLLGAEAYLADFGHFEWQRALPSYFSYFGIEPVFHNELLQDPKHLLFMRSQFAYKILSQATQMYGRGQFLQLKETAQAQAAANAAIQVYLNIKQIVDRDSGSRQALKN